MSSLHAAPVQLIVNSLVTEELSILPSLSAVLSYKSAAFAWKEEVKQADPHQNIILHYSFCIDFVAICELLCTKYD